MTALRAVSSQPRSLAEYEAIIERGLPTFIEVGQALAGIRDGRLYCESHGTFEDYCQERWGFTARYANMQIEAAGTVKAIAETGTIVPIVSESQARALGQIVKQLGPGAAAEILEEAAATGKVTASGITEAAKRRADALAPTPISPEEIARQQAVELRNRERAEQERREKANRENAEYRNLQWHQALANIEGWHHPVALRELKSYYAPLVYDYTAADMHRIADLLHDIANRWDDA